MFNELDCVVVRALQSPTRHVDGTEGIKRQPRVGDQGTVVHVLGSNAYVVESVDHAGMTIWLADFSVDELTLPPTGWEFCIDEISAGVYRAAGVGPGGMRTEATDTDPSVAAAVCREFALRNVR